MIQLDPYIPVFIPSMEMNGYAIGWIDYSQEHHLMWIVALENTEVWVLENHLVRMQKNITVGRIEKLVKKPCGGEFEKRLKDLTPVG